MKKLYAIALLLFVTLSLSFTSKIIAQENKIVASFNGVTEDDYYQFLDIAKNEYLFYDISEEIEISLYDNDFVGKKFAISWEEKELEIIDEEGDPTGETKIVNSITQLTLLK